jgi:hypothetical protein
VRQSTPSNPPAWRWIHATIGPKSTGKQPRQDLTDTLEPWVVSIMQNKDARTVGNQGGHRASNATLNKDRATVCWISHYSIDKEWPGIDDSYPTQPTGKPSAKVLRDLEEWWQAKWIDTTKECPHCAWRREQGKESQCFYFCGQPGKGEIRLFKQV